MAHLLHRIARMQRASNGGFYASPKYLGLVADAFYEGHRCRPVDVRVGSDVLRVLSVDERPITSVTFLDYHEPLPYADPAEASHRAQFAPWVTHDVVTSDGWLSAPREGYEPGPFVDWSGFSTFSAYLDFIKARQKGLIKEHERRRRRLADTMGPLTYARDDRGDDVFRIVFGWKSKQLRDTGANDYLATANNVRFLALARDRGVLLSSTLRANGRLLSAWLGFEHEGTWSGWIFAFDRSPELSRYCLGHQLLRSMLEDSFARGHHQFDFSIGGEEYKWVYATHARVLGPSGRDELPRHLARLAKRTVKRALADRPDLLELARRMRGRIRPLLSRRVET